MDEIRKLKETILKEYPRLSLDDEFSFSCHPGVPCFNECCHDVNIFLTPYDIIRLKKALKMTSGEFLAKFTLMPVDKNLTYPVILLKMTEDDKKACHFLTEKGCGVYEDRPWPCRMYPLGLASPKEGHQEVDKEFYFLLEEAVCKGHGEAKKQTVRQWVEEQGVAEYDAMGQEFKNITLNKFFAKTENLTAQKVEMFFMACYDVDKFRRFVFESRFLEKFVVDEETQQKMKDDDVELLKFGYKWLRFALFGEKTLDVEAAALAEQKRKMDAKKNPSQN